MDVLPVFVVNSSNFDWLTFFLGGATGSFLSALVILGLERIIQNIFEKKSLERKISFLTSALTTELVLNLENCKKFIGVLENSVRENPNSVNLFAKFKTRNLKEFSDQFIDYGNEKSLHLYLCFNNILSLIETIETIQDTSLKLATAPNNHLNEAALTSNNIKFTEQLKLLRSEIETVIKNKVRNKLLSTEEISELENEALLRKSTRFYKIKLYSRKLMKFFLNRWHRILN